MRAKGRSPTSAIVPPAYVANNKFNRSGISNFHCRNEDVNRAKLLHNPPQDDHEAGNMKESAIDRERAVVAHDQAPEVTEPGVGAFDNPSPPVAPQRGNSK